MLIYPNFHEIKSCDYLLIIYMQKFEAVFIGETIYLCTIFRVVGGPSARVSFKLLNFLSGILEYLRSFSVRIRFKRRLSLSQFNPCLCTNRCVNPDITLFMASSSYLFWKPKTYRHLASCLHFPGSF